MFKAIGAGALLLLLIIFIPSIGGQYEMKDYLYEQEQKNKVLLMELFPDEVALITAAKEAGLDPSEIKSQTPNNEMSELLGTLIDDEDDTSENGSMIDSIVEAIEKIKSMSPTDLLDSSNLTDILVEGTQDEVKKKCDELLNSFETRDEISKIIGYPKSALNADFPSALQQVLDFAYANEGGKPERVPYVIIELKEERYNPAGPADNNALIHRGAKVLKGKDREDLTLGDIDLKIGIGGELLGRMVGDYGEGLHWSMYWQPTGAVKNDDSAGPRQSGLFIYYGMPLTDKNSVDRVIAEGERIYEYGNNFGKDAIGTKGAPAGYLLYIPGKTIALLEDKTKIGTVEGLAGAIAPVIEATTRGSRLLDGDAMGALFY